MYFLGFDVGSSAVKASLIEGASGNLVVSAVSPDEEMKISAPQPGWAEQDPETWWENVKRATAIILKTSRVNRDDIKAIGISYQMHGLVLVDKNQRVLRPSIIWCDSRAATIGEKAITTLGKEFCLQHFLNSPGNFTASKIKWVKENEPDIFNRVHKAMLPGDYIAMRMSGEIQTTVTGLSEGIFWDYKEQGIAASLLDYYGIPKEILPGIVPVFAIQSEVSTQAGNELGLRPSTKITYRAGDQPNNAFSLNCLNPGEVAATAGTSGVIYGVTDRENYDKKSRVNIFTHVNHTNEVPRYGILLCINGTGISNSWLRRLASTGGEVSYDKINELASGAKIGSDGLLFYPFGNGAERIFENKNIGASVGNLQFNTHSPSHLLRAIQEGIVFAMNYGLDIMRSMGVNARVVRAGRANMFLSPLFRGAFATVTGTTVELYDTDGAQGAARGAGVGFGFYKNCSEAFKKLEKLAVIEPDKNKTQQYLDTYENWLQHLNEILSLHKQ